MRTTTLITRTQLALVPLTAQQTLIHLGLVIRYERDVRVDEEAEGFGTQYYTSAETSCF